MRRDILVILGITALVVTAVVVLGPMMSQVSPGTTSPANSIPLSPLQPSAPPVEIALDEPPAPLRVEVVDSTTGRHIERDTSVDLSTQGGKWLDQMRGRADGEPIPFERAPEATPLTLRARLPGYVPVSIGPVVIRPGLPKLVRLTLTPLRPVMINPPKGAAGEPYMFRVFSTTAPNWPETRPFSEWHVLGVGGMQIVLPPGRYGLQVVLGDPRKYSEYRDRSDWVDLKWLNRTPGYAIPFPSCVSEFDVGDGPLKLTPELDWQPGQLSISGVCLDREGHALQNIKLEAICCGPGPLRELAGTAKTEADGAFRFERLKPGIYRVQLREGSSLDGEGTVWLGAVKEGEPPRHITLTTTGVRAPGAETGRGTALVRITRRGKPVEGAGLKIDGWGSISNFWTDMREHYLDGKSDDTGLLSLENIKAGGYVVHTIHPYSMSRFEIVVNAGRLTKFNFEIAPEGTAELGGFLHYPGTEYVTASLSSEVGRAWVGWHEDADGRLDMCGIKPGNYTLSASDSDGFEFEYQLEFVANKTLTFEREELPAKVTGELPYPGFWRAGASIEYQDRFDDHGRTWETSVYPTPEWDKGIRIGRVPRRKFSLVARAEYGEQVVAVANVDTSNGDVSEINWIVLRASDEDAGSLNVVCSSGPNHALGTSVSLSIERKDVRRIRLDRASMTKRDGRVECRFDGLPPGAWTVTLEGRNYVTLTTQVLIEAGKTAEVTLDRVPEPEKKGAHDRPIGDTNIKLPPPTAPPVSPPEPLPLPPAMKVPPPLPPRPPTDETPPEGREIWLYTAGAALDQLWCAVVHASDGDHVRTEGVAERGALRVSLVRHDGRFVIVVQGLADSVTSVSLRLPDRDPVRVALKDGQAAYVVELK
jgi:hypothetical protein